MKKKSLARTLIAIIIILAVIFIGIVTVYLVQLKTASNPTIDANEDGSTSLTTVLPTIEITVKPESETESETLLDTTATETETASETATITNTVVASETNTATGTNVTNAVTESTTVTVLGTNSIEPLPEPKTIVINDIKYALVNRELRMPPDYQFPKAYAVAGYDVELHAETAVKYQEMYNAAKAEGIYLTPYSGYRRYSTQERNYNNKIQLYLNQGYNETDARALAARIIMPPGSSEHNLGLAMDICGTDYNFYQTKEYAWLVANAHNYGYILRYSYEKQSITNVVYEPWHWRYVGVEMATDMKFNYPNLCLEEYFSMKGLMPQTY